MATKFSIRYKFLAVTMLLLAVCVGTYLSLATYIFKEDKLSLVFDYNRSIVVNLASDLDNFLNGLSDKMQLVAYFNRQIETSSKARDDRAFRSLLNNLLEQNKDIVWVGGSEDFQSIQKEYYQNQEYIKTYALESGFFTKALVEARPIPYEDIQKVGEAIWTATLHDGGPALIGYGKNVIEENSKGIPIRQFAIISYIRADRMIAALKESSPNESLVVSEKGEILAHSDPKVIQKQKLPDPVLFERAQAMQMRTQVLKYEAKDGLRFGAFANVGAGRILILSSISEATAFKAVNDLVSRSLLFGSILVTLAFLLAIFFSRSLTRPIDVLVTGMKKVAEGDLSTKIRVTSKDEIASLTGHFNNMITDLKKSREELEDINRELENKVKERTLQLEERNVAVKEAQEALLKSTRLAAVGEVAGLAAHEVLNPLTSIISKLNDFKSRLQSGRQSEAQFLLDLKTSWEKDYSEGGFEQLVEAWQTPSSIQTGDTLWQEDLGNLDKVGQNVIREFDKLLADSDFLIEESQRINRIIQSFRGMSSANNEVAELSIHSLCDRSIAIMTDLAAKHDVILNTDYQANTDTALLDEDEFIQVITNLLRNAIQSVQSARKPKGAGIIKLSTLVHENQLLVSIKDNGLGLSHENAKKLFNHKFTTKTKSEGTGIGLSLSRRLARSFKGDIQLKWFEEGQGAEFIVAVPLVNSKAVRSSA